MHLPRTHRPRVVHDSDVAIVEKFEESVVGYPNVVQAGESGLNWSTLRREGLVRGKGRTRGGEPPPPAMLC
jgi:hypothetical protein